MPPQRPPEVTPRDAPDPDGPVGTPTRQHGRVARMEEKAADGAAVAGEGREDHTELLDVPQSDCRVRAAAGQQVGVVRAEGDVQDVVRVPSQPRTRRSSRLKVPHLDGLVCAARRYNRRVLGVEGDLVDSPRVRFLLLYHLPVFVHHPHLDGAIARPGHQDLAVVIEAQRVDALLVSPQDRVHLPALGAPHSDAFVFTPAH
mmetsp:Transcript_9327/g.31204  ORF Transcript_9327/g.31204 Transcript_9327/m.31204 type:complete len:201 (-) Transcript_9327:4360-4962(-)